MRIRAMKSGKILFILLLCTIGMIFSSSLLPAASADDISDSAVAGNGKAQLNTDSAVIGNGWLAGGIAQVINPGDLDSNGWEDMLLIRSDGTLWYYPMNSRTAFSYPRQVGFGWKSMRKVFGGVDFDGDSQPDIFAISDDGKLYLYRGVGNGNFYSKQYISAGWNEVEALSVGGANAAGKALISGVKAGKLYIWETDGKDIIRVHEFGENTPLQATALSPDIDGDGFADMWAVTADAELRLYKISLQLEKVSYYQVDAELESARYLFSIGEGKLLRGILEDGMLRQYTINSFLPQSAGSDIPGSVENLPADIKSTLSHAQAEDVTPPGTTTPDVPTVWGSIRNTDKKKVGNGWPTDRNKVIGLGDFAPNGRSDVGLIDREGQFRVYPMGTNWAFQAPQRIGNGWQGYKPVIGGFDYDKDTRPDLVARTPQGDLRLYTSDGKGRFGKSKNLHPEFAEYSDIFYLRNGIEKKPTIYGLDSSGELYAYVGDGKGNISYTKKIAGDHSFLHGAFSMDDFDKDGYSDLLYIDAKGHLQLARQNSDGSFQAGVRIGYGWQNFTNLVYAGASAEATWVYAVDKAGGLYLYAFQYSGSNRSFSPYPGARPAIVRGYTAPNGYLQPTSHITSLGGATNSLTPGMNGVKVKIVQKKLGIWYGSRLATVDNGTISAVRSFQRRSGLYADGIVGAQTWAHLYTGYPWNVDTFQTQPIDISATRAQRIERMIGYAYAQTGSEYTWGGAGYYALGFDCSGLVLQALYSAGMDPQPINVIKHAWPSYRTSKELYSYGRFQKVPFSQRQRGDLIFYVGSAGVQHVSIYIGNDQVIHTNWMGNPARIDHVTAGYGWGGIAPLVVRPFP